MFLLYVFKRPEIRILQIAGVIHKSKTTCFTFEKTISFYVKDGTLESKTSCFTMTTPPSRVYTRICYNSHFLHLSRVWEVREVRVVFIGFFPFEFRENPLHG